MGIQRSDIGTYFIIITYVVCYGHRRHVELKEGENDAIDDDDGYAMDYGDQEGDVYTSLGE